MFLHLKLRHLCAFSHNLVRISHAVSVKGPLSHKTHTRMNKITQQHPSIATDRILGFVKDNGLWYADLPEFLEAGLGDRNNLLMVAGSDTFLDLLSRGGDRIRLRISDRPFEGHRIAMRMDTLGLDRELLASVGHNPVDYGAYYEVSTLDGRPFQHRLWLCPVTEFVFGSYPENIYASIA
jgi:hypothetical protein